MVKRSIKLLNSLITFFVLVISCQPSNKDTNNQSDNLRIISLVPNLTDILYALDLGDALVANTNYCNFPEDAKLKEKIGSIGTYQWEKILSLHPSLVLLAKSQFDEKDRLKKLAIPYLDFPNETIHDITSIIKTLGFKLNKRDTMSFLLDKINNEIDRVKGKYKNNLEKKKVLLVADHPIQSLEQIWCPQKNTYIHELLQILNVSNITEGVSLGQPYISVPMEYIIHQDPDIIIDYSLFDGSRENEELVKKSWKQFDMIKAVKEGRLYVVSNPYLSVPGSQIDVHLKILESLIYNRSDMQ